MKGNIIKRWDILYKNGKYKKYWEYKNPSQELIAIIGSGIIPKKGTTLDIGCGTGNEAIFLAQCGFNSIGVDISEKALKIAERRARKSAVNVKWVLGNVLNMPINSDTIDFVNDRGCLHHIFEKDRIQYAKEIERVLKPEGHILIRGSSKSDEGYFSVIDEKSIDAIFSKKNFQRGPILPITLVSNCATLESNIVVLKKLPV